jgi:serine/threonine protein kinase
MSQIVLRESKGVLVTLEGDLVRKTVRGLNKSRLSKKVDAKEMVDREIRALQLLQGVPGIQRFVKRESDDTFYTEYIPGISLFESSRNLNQKYFSELMKVIRDCHKRGVYRIGQSRKDFIIDEEGGPVIIDFGNIIFEDDSVAKIPGLIPLAKIYNQLRVKHLQQRYVSRNGFKLFLPNQ